MDRLSGFLNNALHDQLGLGPCSVIATWGDLLIAELSELLCCASADRYQSRINRLTRQGPLMRMLL